MGLIETQISPRAPPHPHSVPTKKHFMDAIMGPFTTVLDFAPSVSWSCLYIHVMNTLIEIALGRLRVGLRSGVVWISTSGVISVTS